MSALSGLVVVITGSSRGFGFSMAQEFQHAGAQVVISSRDAEAVRSAVAGLPVPAAALGLPCDVRELKQVEQLAAAALEKFGALDIWINNAGFAHAYVKMLDVEPAQWRASFETNFLGSYNGCRVALQNMLTRKSGQVINILGFGADRPSPNQSAYGSSKSALWQLTRTLALEYAGTGVAINAVMPGMIWTEMLTRAEGVDEPGLRRRMEWAMRVFGNPPQVPARFVVQISGRGRESGKMYRLITPRVFVPRMIGEFIGMGKRRPRPWESGDRQFQQNP